MSKEKIIKQWRRVLLSLTLAFLILMNPQFLASGTNTHCKIDILNNRLKVDVENVSLGSVLETIHKKTGLEVVVGKDQSNQLISVQFQYLPLDKALKRILNRFMYASLFGPSGDIQKVIIVGNSDTLINRPERKIDGNSLHTDTMFVRQEVLNDMEIIPSSSTMLVELSKEKEMQITYSSRPMAFELSKGNSMGPLIPPGI